FVEFGVSVIDREDVLVASMVLSLQRSSSFLKVSFLTCISADIASMTRSLSATSSRLVVIVILERVFSICSVVIFSFATSFSRVLAIGVTLPLGLFSSIDLILAFTTQSLSAKIWN